MLAVATVEEGISLRQGEIDAPILVMGAYVPGTWDAYVDYDLTATIAGVDQIDALAREHTGGARPVTVHLKVDTGMGRLGVLAADAVELVRKAWQTPSLVVEGIYSHLARADDPDRRLAEKQIQQFDAILSALAAAHILPKYRHILNSAGLLRHPAGQTNMARVGLALFGLYPVRNVEPDPSQTVALKPAMSWKSRVATVKRVPAGTGVSYGHTYQTLSETTLVTIPVGYGDGFKRGLSSRADVLIAGRRFKVAGRICMDHAIVDVGDTPVSVGDEVVLIGRQGNEQIFVEEWAALLDTINYEIVTTISGRVARTYIDDDEGLTKDG